LSENMNNELREARCLSIIAELISRPDANISKVCRGIVHTIPQGFRHPELCHVKLAIENATYQSIDYKNTGWSVASDIVVQGRSIGSLMVCYSRDVSVDGGVTFLPAESHLIESVAQRLSHFIVFRQFKQMADERVVEKTEKETSRKGEWQVVLDLLRQTDRVLYVNISHKMLNHLCWSGIPEAEDLRRSLGFMGGPDEKDLEQDPNLPQFSRPLGISNGLVEEIFRIAASYLSDHDMLGRIQKWIQEDKLSYFVQVANRNLPLLEVANAVRRYHQTEAAGGEFQSPSRRGIKVSLIRRFFSDQLPFISVAKDYIEIGDFFEILQRTIYSPESFGRLGGKSAGLHLARKILEDSRRRTAGFPEVKVPRTWYITSDMMYAFMHYNNFDDIIEQKYKDREQIKYEYPFIVQTFKSSPFPPEMIKGISVALDEFENRPLIVRSSSLLEDNVGAIFSGKYKSLFLPNQGTKKERLAALLDAIAEVYASVFSSDPIEYRTERGLLDFAEEMGIMIQEVVGARVGNYHMPVIAGVAFSNNEFRWSPRIRREDGLLRIVLGLGTRAVDRLSDDYPVLIAPGQPNLRVNVSVDEVLRYAPRYSDVINLSNASFETVEISELLKKAGSELPMADKVVSILEDDNMRKPMGRLILRVTT
jgi:pyruvate,water dikinase